MPHKVCLDVSPIGAPQERWTGLARTTWEFVSQLRSETSLDLRFSAVGSAYAQSKAVEYLTDAELHAQFVGNPIPRFVTEMAQRKSGPLKAVSNTVARGYNLLRHPIEPNALKELDAYFSFYARIPSQVRKSGNISAGIFVHDIIPFLFPEHCSSQQRSVLSRILHSIESDDLVVVNSACTKRDICQRLEIQPERVVIIPLAANQVLFNPVDQSAGIDLLASEYGFRGSGYYLTLHSAAAHKNVPHLIRSYAQYRRGRNGDVMPLVVAGGKGDPMNEVLKSGEIAERDLEGVVFLGFVADEHLAHIYSAATAFFFPSLYEGFGLPVLEALLCGTPAFVSNGGSLVEIMRSIPAETEGAGRLIEPLNVDAWVEAFRVAETAERITPDTINSLRQKYSWSSASNKLAQAITDHIVA